MTDYTRVGFARIDPVPSEIPAALSYFENYFICVNTLMFRCTELLTSLLNYKLLCSWSQGIWLRNYIADLKCAPRVYKDTTADQSLSDIMRMCKSLVSTMSDDTDSLDRFVSDALDKWASSDLQSLVTACSKEISAFVSQLPTETQTPKTLSSQKTACLNVVWIVFWKCFFALQYYCRNKADAELLIRSWRYMPSLVSDILVSPPDTVASKVFTGLRSSEQAACISGECVPYAFWLCSQLVYLNYQRVSTHHALSVYDKAELGKQRRAPRLSDMREVSTFEHFLRKIREVNHEEVIDAYFDAVQGGNRLIQEYAFFDVSNVVFPYVRDVLEEEPPMFLADARRSEFITSGYNEAYEITRKCLKNLQERQSDEDIETSLLQLQLNPSHGTPVLRAFRAAQEFVLRKREEYLATKCVVILLRSWSQGFAQGFSVISQTDLRRHSLKMKKMIRDLCGPLRKLLEKLIAQLEVTSGLNSVCLSFPVSLKIAADLEKEVKDVLMLALQILNERAKFKAKVDARREAEATRQGKKNERVRERHRLSRALYGIV